MPEASPRPTFAADDELIGWMRDIRRTIHRHPELSSHEHKTRSFVSEKLLEIGISQQTELGHTGLVATVDPGVELPGGQPTPCVALRADMDALPIEEKTDLPFSSTAEGVMHACGHDGHVAMLLGAAALLSREKLPGRVKLIFQPAEEKGIGAQQVIKEGGLAGIQAIFAGHIDRHFSVGQIAAEPGLICAYTDPFKIRIFGQGGHAARPHETVDSIVVASLLVMSIQTLISREINPSYPTVVSVGRIQGGTAANVIAEEAVLEGTIRSTHPEVRAQIITGLERMVGSMESLYNARAEISFAESLPPVINHPAAADLAKEATRLVVGESGLVAQSYPSLGGEDFAYYLNEIPGCLVRFGARKASHEDVPAHSPRFDFDEDVLPVGAAFLAQVAWSALDKIERLI
ncbi:MAG: M20 family metallopeptidase [Thermodesulfobacteriota bacterium]